MDTIKRYLAMAGTAIQQLLTGKDNLTIDFARVGVMGTLAAGVAYAGIDVIAHAHAFSFTDFGAGSAAILGGGGLAILAKRRDEPGND